MRRVMIAVVPLLSLYLGACTDIHEHSIDYDRHRFSQIVVPHNRDDVLYYDVTTNYQYPEDNPQAEQVRMAWLNEWMKKRQLWPHGIEVKDRREFDYMEDNPARHDLRYEVQCKPPPLPEDVA